MKRLSKGEVWLCSIVLLLWMVCEVGYALLEDIVYMAMSSTVGVVLLSCYLWFNVRKKFTTALSTQPGMTWISVAVIFNNACLLFAIIAFPLYYFRHNKDYGTVYFVPLLFYIIPYVYFVLMADLALLRKWKSAVFHIRCLLIWAILVCAFEICICGMIDIVKVAYLRWVVVFVDCAMTLVYIVGFMKTFGAKAKLSFPIEERGKKWYEVVTSTIFLVCLCLFVCLSMLGLRILGRPSFIDKEIIVDDSVILDVPEEMPIFSGDVYVWLSNNVKYPVTCQENGVQGSVDVQFVVNRDGSVADVTILRSPDEELSKEAERVVKAMPKWEPARHHGKTVRVRYVLPITFQLNSSDFPKTDISNCQP